MQQLTYQLMETYQHQRKNKTFVDTDYDQSIIGQKTSNTTIHSVGIMVQTYDNSSVVCAEGGVRSIADIQSVSYSKTEDDALLILKADKLTTYSKSETYARDEVYTKTEDDALLLLKADKIQLIDSYTKGETNNLLNNKADTEVSYTKGEDDALLLLKADKSTTYTKGETNNLLNNKADNGISYTKGEDDAPLLLKADKSTTYTKGETNNLLNNKADTGVSYTKGEDDALLLLKADKTLLIDSYTKGETNNLLNNNADNGVSYTKGENDALLLLKADKSTTYTKTEDDTLLLLKADKTQLIDSYTKGETNNLLNNKANQSTTYTKIETDQLLSQVDVGDVDLTNYYNKTKTDEILGEKADTTELSNYVTLGTSQTINANKTFNNACRFVSSNDGISTVTGSSFIKLGADNTVVLLGAGDTKPIAEFGGSVDDSNYVKKTGQELQIIHGVLRRDDDELSMSEYNEDYLTRGEIYDAFISRYDNETIYGTKTFNANVNAAGFAKTGKDDTSVLLAGGGDMLLSTFGRLELVNINYTSNVISPTSIMSRKCYRYGSLINFYCYIYMGNGAGASGASVAVCTLESAGFPKYLFYADDIVFAGSVPHVANFRFGTDGKVTITINALSGTAILAGAASAYINITYPAAN
ncbi:MAG: hypothetical protein EZS28_012483 [Streblomastix strix]|uniref:Uncharacterized protein n=1 Tax=Streblomastix strix TaxID=222440 RepID=A0A5J4WB17_9EUKA|nr:MAG: hypothetical protein EZS28_012483 [Streblomastix strix]